MTIVQQIMALQAEEHERQAKRFLLLQGSELAEGRSCRIGGDGIPEGGADMADLASAHAVVAALIRRHLG